MIISTTETNSWPFWDMKIQSIILFTQKLGRNWKLGPENSESVVRKVTDWAVHGYQVCHWLLVNVRVVSWTQPLTSVSRCSMDSGFAAAPGVSTSAPLLVLDVSASSFFFFSNTAWNISRRLSTNASACKTSQHTTVGSKSLTNLPCKQEF